MGYAKGPGRRAPYRICCTGKNTALSANPCTSAAHRTYRASLAQGNALLFHAIRWKEQDTYFRRAVLGPQGDVLDQVELEDQQLATWLPLRLICSSGFILKNHISIIKNHISI